MKQILRRLICTPKNSSHVRSLKIRPGKQILLKQNNPVAHHLVFFQVRLWLIGQPRNTIVIPPCAVNKMRVTFPAEDGNYTGYKDDDTGDDDDKALMAS